VKEEPIEQQQQHQQQQPAPRETLSQRMLSFSFAFIEANGAAAAARQQQQPVSPERQLAVYLARRGHPMQLAFRSRRIRPGHRGLGARAPTAAPPAAQAPAQRGRPRATRSYWVGPADRAGFGVTRFSRQAVSFGDGVLRHQGAFFCPLLFLRSTIDAIMGFGYRQARCPHCGGWGCNCGQFWCCRCGADGGCGAPANCVCGRRFPPGCSCFAAEPCCCLPSLNVVPDPSNGGSGGAGPSGSGF
jgi:hypothetical protein